MTAVIRVENKKYIVNCCAVWGKAQFRAEYVAKEGSPVYSAPILHTTRFFPIVG